MNNVIAWKELLTQLRKADHAEICFTSLITCSKLHIPGPAILKSYHDTLFFLLANPFDENCSRLAEEELERLVTILRKHTDNRNWQHFLSNSGLPYTEIRCQYGSTMVKWLMQEFPDMLYPVESDADFEVFQQLSQAALPGIEFHHTTQGKYNIWNRIKWLSGHYRNTAALQWLINLIDQQDWTPVLKDQLYDGLKVYVSWKLVNDKTGITFNRLLVKSVFYKKPDKSIADPLAILSKRINGPIQSSLEEKLKLISIVRSSLAFYARETDPVTHADTEETFLYEMGEGLQIALTGMVKDRRLALESYIGYMAFKNGIPVSYGGGWIWGHRCKIGINIYPPFRGRGSDKLFCQILRLYFQVYAVRRFVVKPYQFGKGNPEGLKSGAFWFYYKLGFRPVNEDIKKMADSEWEKISAGKNYRSPLSVLKSFTACNKEWEPVKTRLHFIDADKVSITVTKMINHQFAGNRKLAIESCMKELRSFIGLKKIPKLQPLERKVWHNWSLLFVCMPETELWNKTARKKFHQLLELKANGFELDFIRELQVHEDFWNSLLKMTVN